MTMRTIGLPILQELLIVLIPMANFTSALPWSKPVDISRGIRTNRMTPPAGNHAVSPGQWKGGLTMVKVDPGPGYDPEKDGRKLG